MRRETLIFFKKMRVNVTICKKKQEQATDEKKSDVTDEAKVQKDA